MKYKVDDDVLLTSLRNNPKYTYNNLEIPEQFVVDNIDDIDIDALMMSNDLSENLIIDLITMLKLKLENLQNLSITSHINLSKDFIDKYGKYLNWRKIILYHSTEDNDIKEYLDKVEENNLWDLISANELDIDFIRQYKDKLDWNTLVSTQKFSIDDINEFSDYIPEEIYNNMVTKMDEDNVSDELYNDYYEKLNDFFDIKSILNNEKK